MPSSGAQPQPNDSTAERRRQHASHGRGQQQTDAVHPERGLPANPSKGSTEHEEDGGGRRRAHGLQSEVAVADAPGVVVTDQRRASGHDRRLGHAHQHAACENAVQRVHPQRNRAEQRVQHRRHDQQALAAETIDDDPGNGSQQGQRECGNGQHQGHERLAARDTLEVLLHARQNRCRQHGTEDRQATARHQEGGRQSPLRTREVTGFGGRGDGSGHGGTPERQAGKEMRVARDPSSKTSAHGTGMRHDYAARPGGLPSPATI